MAAAPDAEVAMYAEGTSTVLISKDEDFLLLRLPDRYAFLWLRCGNATRRTLFVWLEERWERAEALLGDGERLVELR